MFLTTGNAGNVLVQTAAIAVLAIGQLLVILTRGIDLSVGSTLALASVVGALAFATAPTGSLVILVMLATGAAVGFVNGVGLRVGAAPPPVHHHPGHAEHRPGLGLQSLRRAAQAGHARRSSRPSAAARSAGSRTRRSSSGAWRWSPWSSPSRMVWGRWIYAVGGNPEAARRDRHPGARRCSSRSTCCAGCSPASPRSSPRAAQRRLADLGDLAELDSIAAVIIGGASFLGGRGTVANALVGALMIGVIRNGMNLLNVDAFLQPIVIGVVIVLAVETDVVRGRLEERFRVLQAART